MTSPPSRPRFASFDDSDDEDERRRQLALERSKSPLPLRFKSPPPPQDVPRDHLNRIIVPFNEGQKRSEVAIEQIIFPYVHRVQLHYWARQLYRYERVDNYRIAKKIAGYLNLNGEAGKSGLRNLRATSKKVAGIFGRAGAFGRSFETLFVSPLYVEPGRERRRNDFKNIALSCRELVVRVPEVEGNHDLATGTVFSANHHEQQQFSPTRGHSLRQRFNASRAANLSDWAFIFQNVANMGTLWIETGATRNGTCFNRTSSALTAMRVAFEEISPVQLVELKLGPIDIVFIGHLQWNGPAHGISSPSAEAAWSRITELEIQVLPFSDTIDNSLDLVQVLKSFNAWLQSFAKQLRILRIAYLGEEEGPHPFMLLNEVELKSSSQQAMNMPELRELWLANVKNVEEGKFLFDELATNLKKVHVLQRGPGFAHNDMVLFDRWKEPWRTIHRSGYRGQAPDALDLQETWDNVAMNYGGPSAYQPSEIYTPNTFGYGQQSSVASPPQPHSGQFVISPVSTDLATPKSSGEGASRGSSKPSSPYKSMKRRSSKGKKTPEQRTSLSSEPAGTKSRSASFTNAFKSAFGKRPKSQLQSMGIVHLGETPADQIPANLRGQGGFITAAEKLNKVYSPDATADLTRLGDIEVPKDTHLGRLGYTTVFQAGPDATSRVPESVRRASAEKHMSPHIRSPEEVERIRQALDQMGLPQSSTPMTIAGPAYGSTTYGSSTAGSSRKESGSMSKYMGSSFHESTHGLLHQHPAELSASPPRRTVTKKASEGSWETVESGWEMSPTFPHSGRPSQEGGRPSYESKRYSYRQTDLEDLPEEHDYHYYDGARRRL